MQNIIVNTSANVIDKIYQLCQTFQYWFHLKVFLLVFLMKNSDFEGFSVKNLENSYKSFYNKPCDTFLTKDGIMYRCYIFIYVIVYRCYILLMRLYTILNIILSYYYIKWTGFIYLLLTANCIRSFVWIK